MRIAKWIMACLVVAMPLLASAASGPVIAPIWSTPDAACLPSRVKLSGSCKPDTCFCPPPSYCPPSKNVATLREYLDSSKMPPGLTLDCCDVPVCPSGAWAGQTLPMDGVCPPIVVQPPGCPADPTKCIAEPPPPVIEISDRGGEGGNGGDDCLRSDSLVSLANGKTKSVNALKIGDKLQGPDGLAEVTAVNRSDGTNALYYRINDLKLFVTGDHPIATTEGWKAADDEMRYREVITGRLDEGDVLVTKKGTVEVKKITLEKTKKGTVSINIQTRDDRSFYVDGVVIKPFKDATFDY